MQVSVIRENKWVILFKKHEPMISVASLKRQLSQKHWWPGGTGSHIGQGAPGLLRNLRMLQPGVAFHGRWLWHCLIGHHRFLAAEKSFNHRNTYIKGWKLSLQPPYKYCNNLLWKMSRISTESLSYLSKVTQLNTAETNSKLRQPVLELSLKMSHLYDRIKHKNIEIIKKWEQ